MGKEAVRAGIVPTLCALTAVVVRLGVVAHRVVGCGEYWSPPVVYGLVVQRLLVVICVAHATIAAPGPYHQNAGNVKRWRFCVRSIAHFAAQRKSHRVAF